MFSGELTKKDKLWLERYKKMAHKNEGSVMEEDCVSNDYNDEMMLSTNFKELTKDILEKVVVFSCIFFEFSCFELS